MKILNKVGKSIKVDFQFEKNLLSRRTLLATWADNSILPYMTTILISWDVLLAVILTGCRTSS